MTDQEWELITVQAMFDSQDWRRFRRWAIERHYADSAYAFRKLLEILDARLVGKLELAQKLRPLYERDQVVVAAICDEVLDPSGALLGYVRADHG
jgi:hypothetical protein